MEHSVVFFLAFFFNKDSSQPRTRGNQFSSVSVCHLLATGQGCTIQCTSIGGRRTETEILSLGNRKVPNRKTRRTHKRHTFLGKCI